MIPKLGVCYYPEHWPEDQWKVDAQRMAQLGLTWVRIGEFSWSKIEPEENTYNWGWLDRAVAVLHSHGLKVVMGTPTATPPNWMVKKYPDMIAVLENGQPRKFGSRRHYCFSYLPYRNECQKIVEEMAKRYGDHPAVQAWQTDNEYGCHDTTISYSKAAESGFRDWLAQKYQSPQALNKAWGNVFWSMEYIDFADVDLPNQTVTEPNPAHVMDFRRFTSDQVVAFNKVQTDVLRKYTKADLIHNYMGRTTDFDHFDVGADLDIASWDSYPLGFLEMISDASESFIAEYAHQGDPDFQAFHHDLYRSVGQGRWWVMEQQPGPVNWAAYNPSPAKGMVRVWTWEAIAHGAESVCYFRWRQAPFAQEQMHAGLRRVDDKEAPAFEEAAKVAIEISEYGEIELAQAPVAILFDYPSQWAWEIQPQSKNFDYFKLIFETYSTLRQLGVDVDIVPASCRDLSKYKMLFAPGAFNISDDLKIALDAYDGFKVLGPRYNSKTSDFSFPETLPPNISNINVSVARVQTLRPNMDIELVEGGAAVCWIEELEHDSTVLEKSVNGSDVVLQNNSTIYLGACLDITARKRVFKRICKQAKVETEDMPKGLRKRRLTDGMILTNYDKTPHKFHDLEIDSCDVKVIKA